MIKIWIFLVLLTLLSFSIGSFDLMNASLVLILLISTFIKGHLVVECFMGLKKVSLRYRIIPSVWLAFVLVMVSVAYYLPV